MALQVGLLASGLSSIPGIARCDFPGQDLWAGGKSWLSLRAGFAANSADGAGDGGIGYGFGFSHMIGPLKIYKWSVLKQFAIGAYVHHEVLSRFGSAAEIEIPLSLELVRHFAWKTPFRPYLGLGGGPFYRKTYRTGDDTRTIKTGGYLTFGANSPIGGHQLLGLDVRLIQVDSSYIPPNPVFGAGSAKASDTADGIVYEKRSATHWSAKVSYSLAY